MFGKNLQNPKMGSFLTKLDDPQQRGRRTFWTFLVVGGDFLLDTPRIGGAKDFRCVLRDWIPWGNKNFTRVINNPVCYRPHLINYEPSLFKGCYDVLLYKL